MLHRYLPVVLFLFTCSASRSQPSGDQILKNIEANFAGIDDYAVTLDAKVDVERLKVPEMKATMYFKRPDKIRFISEGFALLPKDGVGFTPGNLTARFDVENVKDETSSYVLTMHPKNDRTKLRKVFLVVSKSNWTVKQLTTPQFDGRQMKAGFEYAKVEGHWLPSQLVVTFSSDSTAAEQQDLFGQLPAAQRPSQVPRTGTIKVWYTDYRLNTGVQDAFFENKSNEGK